MKISTIVQKRLYYYSSSRLDSGRANVVHVLKMCSALKSKGFDVTLISTRRKRRTDLCQDFNLQFKFKVVEFPVLDLPKIKAAHHCINTILTCILMRKPDISYTRNIYAAATLSLFGRSTILELHEVHNNFIVRRVIRWIVKRSSTKAVVVISDVLKNDLNQALSLEGIDKFIVAHDAADQTDLNALNDTSSPSINKEDKSLLVGYVGSLYPGKGLTLITQLAKRLENDRFIHFHIYGGSEQEVKYWTDQAPFGNITWHGRIPHSKVAVVMKQFDIALLPNQQRVSLEFDRGDIGRWTSPLKLFEYMSCGLPIIASDLPVLREVLSSGDNALLCEPENVVQWHAAIDRLKTDPDLRKNLGERALKLFQQRYTWENRVNSILSELTHITHRGREKLHT